MRIAINTNVLLAQLLRRSGRTLHTQPQLQLFMAEYTWTEARRRLPGRLAAQIRHGKLDVALLMDALDRAVRVIDQYVHLVGSDHYATFEITARQRVSDADDWHTAALALAHGAAIRIEDRHFWGCGIAVWTTEKLRTHIDGAEPRVRQ